jgi:hypothetical protein
MAGGIAGSGVSAAIAFERAGPAQEHEVRAILREVPLGGKWAIALAREPDGFGGPHLPAERHDMIIARDSASGAAVGLCERVVRRCYLGGQMVDLPYLGALRIVPSHRHRIAVLRGGFAMLRTQCEREGDFPAALTSITSDNSAARRLLTAGLKGFPRYVPLCDFSTFALRPRPAPRDDGIALAQDTDLPVLAAFLAEALVQRDCAPVWTAEALGAMPGLRVLVLREEGAITGCIAVWDQRASRQAVLTGCPRLLHYLRGPANLSFRIAGLPAMPALGRAIDQAFLSLVATLDDCPRRFIRLVRAGLGEAQRVGVAAAMLGIPSAHAWRASLKGALRAIEYRTSLFAAAWPGDESFVRQIDPERVFPEIGLL